MVMAATEIRVDFSASVRRVVAPEIMALALKLIERREYNVPRRRDQLYTIRLVMCSLDRRTRPSRVPLH